jgi:hypothetical protein
MRVRTRRITVEIAHRSISIRQMDSRSNGEAAPALPAIPSVCAVCGAPWTLVSAEADVTFGDKMQQIFYILTRRGLHSYYSAGDKLWVCSRSFQDLSENR